MTVTIKVRFKTGDEGEINIDLDQWLTEPLSDPEVIGVWWEQS